LRAPVTAPGLADVGARDSQPPELLRSLEHPLQQLAIAGLELSSLSQGDAAGRDPLREPVPRLLQVAEVEHPRAAGGNRHRSIQVEPRKRLADKRGELQLEPPDLATQLGARRPLVAIDANLGADVSLQ
jgi:hypothetical protein